MTGATARPTDPPPALGSAPSACGAGGKDLTLKVAIGACSLGSILIAATERGLAAILLGDEGEALVRDLQRRFPRGELVFGDEGSARLLGQVVALVEEPRLGAMLPLDVRGTAFQESVWEALLAIPPGATASYTDVARSIGRPRSVRAVAQACAANALAVAIPCHRVVRSNGGLSGYRWGLGRKQALLLREATR